jgi:Acetyltransferase (GNAT) domain
MHSYFSILSHTDLGPARWDALCAESDNAWLFHTSCWPSILKIEDLSFVVVDHVGKPLSLVRIGSARNRTGKKLWLYNARAGIAHMNGLPVQLQRELDRFVLSEVRRIAKSKRALRIDWELPSMPPVREALVSALRESGYQCDLQPSKVIDLTLDEDALWRDYRKGCKSVIRRAQRLGVTVNEVTDESGVAIFADLHSRRMRSIGASSSAPDVYTEMWRLLAPFGHCEILLASLPSGAPVSGIISLSYKDSVYYHAACSDPDHMECGGNTLLIHEAMLRAKSRGATLFHMGPSPLVSQVSQKAYHVGRFKNQFGGQERAWIVASLRTQFSVRGMLSAILPP